SRQTAQRRVNFCDNRVAMRAASVSRRFSGFDSVDMCTLLLSWGPAHVQADQGRNIMNGNDGAGIHVGACAVTDVQERRPVDAKLLREVVRFDEGNRLEAKALDLLREASLDVGVEHEEDQTVLEVGRQAAEPYQQLMANGTTEGGKEECRGVAAGGGENKRTLMVVGLHLGDGNGRPQGEGGDYIGIGFLGNALRD